MSKLNKTLAAVDKGASRLQVGCWAIVINLFLVAFCLWGIYAAYIGWQLQTKGALAPGTVVRLEMQDGGTYAPVVSFDVNGQTYTFESDNSSRPPAYDPGEQVDVRYDPANPNTAQIDSFFQRWGLPAIAIPVTLFLALLINGLLLRAWQRGEAV